MKLRLHVSAVLSRGAYPDNGTLYIKRFTHSYVGGSMTGIMADLEDIWLNAIETELDIQKQELYRYKVNI